MLKFFMILLTVLTLNGDIVGGIKAIVKQDIITLSDLREEMQKSGASESVALDTLIRKKLEASEIASRKISIDYSEVYDEIKRLASSNNMSIDGFYEMVRQSSGLNSSEFKELTKERLLSQKLYSEISYSSITPPSEDELKEYYNLHKEDLMRPTFFDVIIYSSSDKELLQSITTNPMLNATGVSKSEQKLFFNQMSPDLLRLLELTPKGKFTPIVQIDSSSYSTFFIKNIGEASEDSFDKQKLRITNMIYNQKREQVLSDYFEKLKNSSDIKILR